MAELIPAPDIWLCLTPNRLAKTRAIMSALKEGWPGARLIVGAPPDDGLPFVVWGQIWLAEEIIVRAYPSSRKFYQIDNGFMLPAQGRPYGYYRFMYSRPDAVAVTDEPLLIERMLVAADELKPKFKPLRQDGEHVLIGMPGPEFGRAHGLDMPAWIETIVDRVKAHTARPLRVRDRMATSPLADDLRHCWAVVTHSSNIAVDAIRAGIPVFVEPTSMAWPVGNHELSQIETPYFPDEVRRGRWWASLMCQQFSLNEMRRGVAYRFLTAIHQPVPVQRPAPKKKRRAASPPPTHT